MLGTYFEAAFDYVLRQHLKDDPKSTQKRHLLGAAAFVLLLKVLKVVHVVQVVAQA